MLGGSLVELAGRATFRSCEDACIAIATCKIGDALSMNNDDRYALMSDYSQITSYALSLMTLFNVDTYSCTSFAPSSCMSRRLPSMTM